jgi:hypothetical protein
MTIDIEPSPDGFLISLKAGIQLSMRVHLARIEL